MDVVSGDPGGEELRPARDGFLGDLQVLGESGVTEEVVLGFGQGFLDRVELGLEVGLVRVGGGGEVLVGCGGGECGGDGYGGGEFFHGRLLGLGWRIGGWKLALRLGRDTLTSAFRSADVKNPASLSAGGVKVLIAGDVRWCGYRMVLGADGERPRILRILADQKGNSFPVMSFTTE